MSKIIVFASGKGGTGKTTVTANLAIALCKKNNKVLLIDCDCGMRGLDLMLGLDKNLVYDTGDIIAGNCFTGDAVYPYQSVPGLFLLPAPMNAEDEISPKVMKQFIHTIEENYDYILIDSPAGVGSGFETAMASARSCVIVINPEPTSIRGALNIRSALQKNDITDIRLIINRFNEKNFKELNLFKDLDEVIDLCETQLIGVIPDDYRLVSLSQQGKPNLNTSATAEVFSRIADRIAGKSVQLGFPKKM
ncbi:MAG: septum site-determining protein MinD [Oscillospiraceae bacterium]|nr:septum site-determining protein MinD [Oscillospiraceae bacterium]